MDEDVTDVDNQLEINISNTNSESEIVLNDLRLLELLYMYPFIFSEGVRPQNDKDYEEWGWEQITNAFNQSYDSLESRAPFSTRELQCRWDLLRPLCPSLEKVAHHIPNELCVIIGKINRIMQVPASPSPSLTSPQEFLLSQTEFLEQLTEEQRRSIEVEVLDVIFNMDRQARNCQEPTTQENESVEKEISEILTRIEVSDEPENESPVQNGVHRTSANNENTLESSLVISSICHIKEELPNEKDKPPAYTPCLKAEPADQQEEEPQPPNTHDLQLRYVPLKSVKYYIKRVEVKLKRLDFDDYIPRTSVNDSIPASVSDSIPTSVSASMSTSLSTNSLVSMTRVAPHQ